MTLQPYGPAELDHFALYLFDLAANTRQMAQDCREFEIDELALHDKKAREWCTKLEDWVHRARADLDLKIQQSRARRRALSTGIEARTRDDI